MNRRAALLVVTAATALLTTVAGCGLFGGPARDDDRFVTAGNPRTSPSGQYSASLADGPPQNGVATQIVVIADKAGNEVFRDTDAYSTRHGVAVTWLSSSDQLWILSSDVGTAHIQPDGGTWTKTAITPETRKSIPKEITELQ